MRFEKKHLDDIKRCYCASHMDIDDETIVFFASEDPESTAKAYYGENFEKSEYLWNDRGGCMSIIPFATRKGEFLAVNEFYLKVSPSHAKLVWGKKTEDGYEVKDVMNLPYLHRFDIYHVNGKDYFIGATIARDKCEKNDWTRPGQIYVGEVPADPATDHIVLRQIGDGYFHNHGYSRGTKDGKVCGYFGSDQGIVRVTPPYAEKEDWKVEKIMDGRISEIALCDLDNDGNDEIMTIEPFHGNTIKIYHVNGNGEYEEVWKYENEIDFAHALVGTTLNGVNSFVAGVRRIDCELFTVQYVDGKYVVEYVEKGVGPANIDVIHTKNGDYILSANHTMNEAAIYKVME